MNKKIAILIPCYNEELTVKKVVSDFKKEVPNASVYVYDNNSSDNTYIYAKEAGAIVKKEKRQGKGNVVRSMFRDIDADIYILVDGDDTYPANEVHKLISEVNNGYDMVIGDRLSNGSYAAENKRGFHNLGNNLVKYLINSFFKTKYNDIMTGYRGFSKRFVKTIPIMSEGFQIETELSIKSLVYRYSIFELPIVYKDRPEGSFSKLNTVNDGIKVLITLFDMYKEYRPLYFFSAISVVFSLVSILIGYGVIKEFVLYHYISKIPSAVLAASIFVISTISMTLGLILDYQKNIDLKNHEKYINNWIYIEGKRDEE